MATRAQAEAALVSLRPHLQAPWFAGTSIATAKCGGDNAHIMVMVRDAPLPWNDRMWHGVRVQFVPARDSGEALGGDKPLVAQDYANLALGALALVGTFLVGKIAVDNIIQSRKEHFDRKGQPPAAVKAKETTLDGVIKVAASAFSVYQITQQFPEVVKAAKKLLE